MLGDKMLKAFIPTTMPERAKLFYRDVLGLKLLSEDNFALLFEGNGTLIRIIIVHKLKPQAFTVLGWSVKNIAKIIKSLNEKGIYCERYGFFKQNKLGVWTSPAGSKVAWFKDPDGNILSLSE
jgi:catechol 2,3-dioxygenase-like lactoylglutathione lyase family enzyme